jgi:hypothetical protein
MTAAPDLSAWPTQTEAAVQLGTNERTIRRWIEAGRLRAGKRPVAGAKPQTVIDPDSIKRLQAERERGKPVVMPAPEATIRDPDNLPHAMPDVRINGELARIDPFAGLAAHLAKLAAYYPTPPPTLPGPFISLEEAAAISGMPKSWLLAQAKAGVPWAINISTGKRARWRFSIAHK